MIRLEHKRRPMITRRTDWVVLHFGPDKFLIDPAEAVDLANLLVDASEQEIK